MWDRKASEILEENTGSNYFDIKCSNFLEDTFSEAKERRAKINYWDSIKIKYFWTVKETVSKTERQTSELQNIFANDISDTGLTSKIYKQL